MMDEHRCKAEFQHLQNELNLATGAGPTDIVALQHAARRMSGIAARLEALGGDDYSQ
ncbi:MULTISPECIES: hypothetical protein [unclassified Bradyrhizobium]|uniref:hypothetical protein n=1 Tax=unclassified Bradyrhizobium TaxID=2631580 RepID=UPI001FF8AA97|nr:MULTISPECIES: hypothetical protein [unclassified Bradyrhizobium]MCK1408184.1 hypothetical protein [Bradyrhizobium sp. 76]UPJ59981.1 hypothetical protein IVB24_10050 [Bradyrhizobium sp. 192]